MAKPTLKPCPFCAGNATVIPIGEYFYKVVCENCQASTADYYLKPLAIAVWNRRDGQ